jgi:polysulfide reductase chain C
MSEIHWGMPIAIYLFLAGLSAGGFCFTALAGRKTSAADDTPERKIASFLPFMLAVGILMLVLDLGQQTSFWKLLINFRLGSPMSLGAWILGLFSILSVIWAIILLPEKFRPFLAKGPKWLLVFGRINRQKLGFWGSALAVLVAVYTGVLLSSAAVPLWNWMLPLLFLFSSFSTGIALGFFVGFALSSREGSRKAQFEKTWMQPYRTVLLGQLFAVVAFLLLAYVTQPRVVLFHLITGGIGLLWWVGAVGGGILFPLIMTFYQGTSHWALPVAIVVEFAGAFIMRWSVLLAGQA